MARLEFAFGLCIFADKSGFRFQGLNSALAEKIRFSNVNCNRASPKLQTLNFVCQVVFGFAQAQAFLISRAVFYSARPCLPPPGFMSRIVFYSTRPCLPQPGKIFGLATPCPVISFGSSDQGIRRKSYARAHGSVTAHRPST